MTSSTTLCAKGGVGDAAWLRVLPRTKNPARKNEETIFSAAFNIKLEPFPKASFRGVVFMGRTAHSATHTPVVVFSESAVESGQLPQLHLA